MFLLRARFWLTLLKIVPLVFVAWMVTLQIPELLYDLGPKSPQFVESLEELTRERFPRSTFVSIAGTPDFSTGFRYRRYGLTYTYFTAEPYGARLVVRTYDPVVDEKGKIKESWLNISRFVGKLRPFERQPFSYRIREYFQTKRGIDIPPDAFFLALYDTPKLSGWQLGAVIFASLLWIGMFYAFFIHKWKKPAPAPAATSPLPDPSASKPEDD